MVDKKIKVTLGHINHTDYMYFRKLVTHISNLVKVPTSEEYDFRVIELLNEGDRGLIFGLTDTGGGTVLNEKDTYVKERQREIIYSAEGIKLKKVSEVVKIIKDGKTIEERVL